MKEYFCVFKLKGAARSTTASYTAENTATAITRLMKLAQVDNTKLLDSAELLEVVSKEDGKTTYVRVFNKLSEQEKGKVYYKHENPPKVAQQVKTPALPAPAKEEKATFNSPYTVRVL